MHETEAMRRFAMRLGVPDSAILLDRGGIDTHETVSNTSQMFRRLHAHRVLVVSHFFHLPRIKMAYQRAGWNVYTVPVTQPQLQYEVPFLVMREVAGLWTYYLRPLANV
ncbi:MAG TPA: YdcF family protein [Armatimonadota bacterium]|nr:YdcF family protein [Armatimonadota bacterium]